MLEKTYDAKTVEPKIAKIWEEADAFRAGAGAEEGAEAFTIVIPPPNVTGSLHMGHALNNTLQDILVRFERMRGKNVLWQPGMDHAGIATQMVVERQLMEKQIHRRDLTREEFIEKVWEWKAESGGAIFNQLKRLGASADWCARTLHHGRGPVQGRARSVRHALQAGPDLQGQAPCELGPEAADRDLRPRGRAARGQRQSLALPLSDRGRGSTRKIRRPSSPWRRRGPKRCWATRRSRCIPTTSAIAHLVGKNVVLPIVGRKIPIVADEYSDPEKGTGAVKITPAHDFNDFEVGKRHKLPAINILTVEAAINLKDNEDFLAGLDVDAGAPGGLGRAQRPRPLRGAQEDRRADGRRRLPRQDRAASPCRAAWRPRRRADRAVPDRAVVCQRGRTGQAGDRLGARGPHQLRAEELGKDLFRLDGEHPALVHFAPALVGPPDSGLVRAGRASVFVEKTEEEALERGDRALPGARRAVEGLGRGQARELQAGRDPDPRRGRARHLVLVGAVAVLDARLAGPDAGAEDLLPDRRAGDRLRHHLLLGRPHDDDGPAFHGRGAVPHGLRPRAGARQERRRRCRSRRATSSIRSI